MTVSAVDKLPLAPSAEPAPPLRLSFGEYLDWLDEDKHAEWVNGEVIMRAPVTRQNNSLCLFIMTSLWVYSGKFDLGKVFHAPFLMEIGTELTARMPDVFFVANENRHRIQWYMLDGPADLVVEVVSRDTRARDRGEKYYEYEQAGVKEYWILDPERRRAEFYFLGDDGRYSPAPIHGDGRFQSAVLPGFWLKVDWLWQEPLPTLQTVMKAWGG